MLNKSISNPSQILSEISVFVSDDKLLIIEKKSGLSKGAKIGIIIGICILFVICIVFIILYRTGVLSKICKSSKSDDNKVDSYKARSIATDEVTDNRSNESAIKDQNDKYMQ